MQLLQVTLLLLLLLLFWLPLLLSIPAANNALMEQIMPQMFAACLCTSYFPEDTCGVCCMVVCDAIQCSAEAEQALVRFTGQLESHVHKSQHEPGGHRGLWGPLWDRKLQ